MTKYKLPKLPPMKRKKVTPKARLGDMSPKEGGWGGVGQGRWFENRGRTAVGGTCARCGETAPAQELKLTWNKELGDIWVHIDKEKCE